MFEKYIIDENNIDMAIPTSNSKYFNYYKINNGDTLYKIAISNNIKPSVLAWLNGLNESDYIYPGEVLLVPKIGTTLYITNTGDTLEDVANNFNTDINTLINENSKIYLQPEQLITFIRK